MTDPVAIYRILGATSLMSKWPYRTSALKRTDLPGQLDFLRGTLAPFFRASERPMAIACFLLFTAPPFPPLPDRKVPRFLRRIALRTVLAAAFPYLAIFSPFVSASIRTDSTSNTVFCRSAGHCNSGAGTIDGIVPVRTQKKLCMSSYGALSDEHRHLRASHCV
jgi:hypothetical protein